MLRSLWTQLYAAITLTVPGGVAVNNELQIIGTCIHTGPELISKGSLLRFSGSLVAQSIRIHFVLICENCMKSAIFMAVPASDSFRLFNIVNVHDLPLCYYMRIRILKYSLKI